MDVVFLIGRILFVLVFVLSGLTGHFQSATVEYARAKGAPAPGLLVPLTGIAIAVGGLAIALGVLADLGAIVLGAFTLVSALIIHAFWREQDSMARQNEFAHFMKNVSVIGGAVIIFWVYNQLQDLPLSITDPLFSPW